jgi:hypothetical protein
MDATYLKTRSAIHFEKDQPSESHVVVEAHNTGETASRIWQNTTAIPGTGNFSATSLYSPSTSITAGDGRFSLAPDGDLAYCNGEESVIWGGAEREIAGFINYDSIGGFSYDFTEQLRNTKTDTANTATLVTRSGGNDANCLLLLNFNNNLTDESTGGATHTFTDNNMAYSTTGAIFGSHAAVFSTNAYINETDHANFDLSGGTFTIDLHYRPDDTSSDYSLYYQNTAADTDSFNLMVDTNGAVLLRIKAGGTKQFSGAVDFTTADGVIIAGTDYHIELVHTANDWYIFVDGALKAYLSDAAEPANYTGDVQIGYDGTTYLEGKMDAFRLSNVARFLMLRGIRLDLKYRWRNIQPLPQQLIFMLPRLDLWMESRYMFQLRILPPAPCRDIIGTVRHGLPLTLLLTAQLREERVLRKRGPSHLTQRSR